MSSSKIERLLCELRKEIMKECELELGMRCSEEKRGRGRPRKERKESSEEKRGRGRPRKERKESVRSEELIASLIGMGNGEKNGENDEEKNGENDEEKNGENDEEKNGENDEEKNEEKNGEKNGENDEEKNGENDGEETEVIKFTINGKIYLKSEENILYDFESHDAVGIWDECEKEIKEIPDEEE